MKIVLVSPAVAPFSECHVLSDDVAQLAGAFQRLGADVATISPRHRTVGEHGPESTDIKLNVRMGRTDTVSVKVDRIDEHWFLDYPPFFDREGLFGADDELYVDNAARYILFSRAAVEMLRLLDQTDVVHSHDWPAGLVPMYMKTLHREEFSSVRSVLTIHDLADQGRFWALDMALTGLDDIHFNPGELEYYGDINLLKGGVVHADLIVVSSPQHADEIQSPALGHGLHGVFHERAGALRGVVHGVDTSTWNPSTDTTIAAKFSADDLDGKTLCKLALQKLYGFPVRPHVPLVVVPGPIDTAESIEGLRSMITSLRADLQVIVVASGNVLTEVDRYRGGASDAVEIAVERDVDEGVARLLYSGSDICLLPWRNEPCGRQQLYAYRYGTLPIVCASGGFLDTVEDGVTGFLIKRDPEAIAEAVDRAVAVYREVALWRAMVSRIMALDVTWETTANRYLSLFRELLDE